EERTRYFGGLFDAETVQISNATKEAEARRATPHRPGDARRRRGLRADTDRRRRADARVCGAISLRRVGRDESPPGAHGARAAMPHPARRPAGILRPRVARLARAAHHVQ